MLEFCTDRNVFDAALNGIRHICDKAAIIDM